MEREICSICQDDLLISQEYSTLVTACHHKFHRKCFRQHLSWQVERRVDLTCPLCRTVIKIETNANVEETDEYIDVVGVDEQDIEQNQALNSEQNDDQQGENQQAADQQDFDQQNFDEQDDLTPELVVAHYGRGRNICYLLLCTDGGICYWTTQDFRARGFEWLLREYRARQVRFNTFIWRYRRSQR